MTFKTPLSKRLHIARRRNERYVTDPDYRLSRINERRLRSGLQPYAALEHVPLRRVECSA